MHYYMHSSASDIFTFSHPYSVGACSVIFGKRVQLATFSLLFLSSVWSVTDACLTLLVRETGLETPYSRGLNGSPI